ncbi:hypothetical protein I7I48_02507 [Histoplasma ohiense]|nr:hypothetical protein I7I48_02507 [Histoplasma ohiense (nom. inval.)]
MSLNQMKIMPQLSRFITATLAFSIEKGASFLMTIDGIKRSILQYLKQRRSFANLSVPSPFTIIGCKIKKANLSTSFLYALLLWYRHKPCPPSTPRDFTHSRGGQQGLCLEVMHHHEPN